MESQQGRPEIAAGINDSMREVRFTSAEGEGSIRSKLAQGGPIVVRLSIPSDQDVEGHSLGDSAVLVLAALDDNDVEGHALSIHFPDAGQARRFRNELIAAGALTATLALGVGLSQLAPSANLGQTQAGTSTPNNAVWIVPHQVAPIEGGMPAPAVQVPHQVAPIEDDATAPAVQIPHQVPPDDL